MAGIYIHIPFCKKACHYCNFHFSTSYGLINDYVNALLKEIYLQKNYITEPVSSIYFGGGTPSLLPLRDLKLVFEKLYNTYNVKADIEITLEANPDDITIEKLSDWKALGINRLSIGIQSFFERDLQWMNRAHNAEQAVNAIHLCKQQQFNITIDLIYGTPTLTDEHWQQNVQQAIALNIPHLSCYALTVEPKTALEKMIAQNKMEAVDTDKQARHFEILMQQMDNAGYEHYEISNFAKPGFHSKHNSSYWQGKPYVGLGPSAHSFNGHSRQWNVANNAVYIQSLNEGKLPYEKEELTNDQQLNEYIMTSLRTSKGLSLQIVEERWGTIKAENIISSAQKYLGHADAELNNRNITLTRKGKFLADGIAAHLFQ